MKTLFLGTPDFSLPALRVTQEETQLLGVICQPDRPRGRGQKTLACPVKIEALRSQLKVWSPASLKKDSLELTELMAWIESQKPWDLFIVVAYGNLLPQSFLDIPKLGCINIHASLLPRWRGAAPIQRALESGDLETGVAIQKMVLELDAGDVLIEKTTNIAANENSVSLSERLSSLGAECLRELLKSLSLNKGPNSMKQQDPANVCFAQKIKKEEGYWNPAWSAKAFHNKIRAFFAWPGVKILLKNDKSIVKILATELKTLKDFSLIPSLNLQKQPCFILNENRVLYHRSGEQDVLVIKQVQAESSKAVDAWTFFSNYAHKYSLSEILIETPVR